MRLSTMGFPYGMSATSTITSCPAANVDIALELRTNPSAPAGRETKAP